MILCLSRCSDDCCTSDCHRAAKGVSPLNRFVDKFVARLNVEHLQRKLAEETDDNKRQTLARLLEEEEAKLAALEASKNEDREA